MKTKFTKFSNLHTKTLVCNKNQITENIHQKFEQNVTRIIIVRGASVVWRKGKVKRIAPLIIQ